MAESPYGSLRSRGSHHSPGDRTQSSDESNRSGHLIPFGSPGSDRSRTGGSVSGYSSDRELEKAPAGPSVTSPFVRKLYQLVNDPETQTCIAWSEVGTSFVVPNEGEFTKNILLLHFNEMRIDFSGFVRQLKRYGFYVNGSPNQRTCVSPRPWEFSHPKFLRDRPELLDGITRQKASLAEAVFVTSPTSGSISPSSSVPDAHIHRSPPSSLAHSLPLPSLLVNSQSHPSIDSPLPSPILSEDLPPIWQRTGFDWRSSSQSSLSDLGQSQSQLDITSIFEVDNDELGETERQITDGERNTLSPGALQAAPDRSPHTLTPVTQACP